MFKLTPRGTRFFIKMSKERNKTAQQLEVLSALEELDSTGFIEDLNWDLLGSFIRAGFIELVEE